MIERYTSPVMNALWGDAAKYLNWLQIELAVCREMARLGIIPEQDNDEIQVKAWVDFKDIADRERDTRHDVLAFVQSIESKVGSAGRWIHYGLTSSDIVDTGMGITLRKFNLMLGEALRELRQILMDLQVKHMHDKMVGRTHGMHAEEITVGHKFKLWGQAIKRAHEWFLLACHDVEVGKISGAVGTSSKVDPRIEDRVLAGLHLKKIHSGQAVPRDVYAHYINSLALIGNAIEVIATEIRHLQRTEVNEMREPFGKGQQGSSAMPHKRNPIRSEQLCGMARMMRGYAGMMMENTNLWHERDISHSSVDRVVIPDATTLIHHMVHSMISILSGLEVDTENMEDNLAVTHKERQSQDQLLQAVKAGKSREEAYKDAQKDTLTNKFGNETLECGCMWHHGILTVTCRNHQ